MDFVLCVYVYTEHCKAQAENTIYKIQATWSFTYTFRLGEWIW